jgi:hypothetical protein
MLLRRRRWRNTTARTADGRWDDQSLGARHPASMSGPDGRSTRISARLFCCRAGGVAAWRRAGGGWRNRVAEAFGGLGVGQAVDEERAQCLVAALVELLRRSEGLRPCPLG